jgi:CHAT domain-containing protein
VGLNEGSDDIVLQSFNEYLSAIGSINLINKEFGREGSRLLFNESVKDLYYGALETGYYLSTHNHRELAEQLFLINEKSRNKILLSGFMDQIAKRLSGIPDSILIMEKSLNEEISLCVKNLLIDPAVNVKEHSGTYFFYLNKLIELRWGIDSIKIQYENSSPVYRKIKEQETANTYPEIQQQLVPEEALLEYFIGDTSLFIFVARSDSLMITRVPVSSCLNDEISKFSKEIRLAEHQNLNESGYDLYCTLILPVKSSLHPVKKLIIIPDENLATIPFEALVSDNERPANNSSYDHPSYLLNDFEITYQFSSSLWGNSRGDDQLDLESMNYAGFAPVQFSYEKNVNETDNGVSFGSLPFSKQEVNEISDLIIKNSGKTHLFLEQRATEKNFRSTLEDYSIIHIATHSMINDQQPGHSGLVFFPDNIEEKDRSTYDGILYLEEIFNLRINPDLLVLSACATGTGKITRSEGVLAMTRGFFTAGAPNIVYTLWNVTDKHTKDFMVSFFDGLLAGQTYSCALRNAKIKMIRKPETSLPRLWAPYVLLGQ